MNWTEAIEAMRAGRRVRRVSGTQKVLACYAGTLPVYDVGTEPIMLAAAWTDDAKPVRVFVGAWSKVLFAPGHEYENATDWVTVDD